jgi:glycine/D-amino acid oxidase-like deaminating enzyme
VGTAFAADPRISTGPAYAPVRSGREPVRPSPDCGCARDEGIDCDFLRVDGHLFLAPEHSPDLLERERDAARRAGLEDVEIVARAPISSFDTGRCLRFPREGQFHPLEYLAGLEVAFRKRGGVIHTGTHAARVEGGSQARVETEPARR